MVSEDEREDKSSTRERVFDFLVAYKQEHDGNSPSLREIAEACLITPSGVVYHLTRLELDHRIHLENGRCRMIEIVGASWHPPGEGTDWHARDQSDLDGSCTAGSTQSRRGRVR